MGKKTNPAMIGVFVMGAIALAASAVIFFAGGKFLSAEKLPYVLFFDGTVNGLGVGAPVQFMGVKIGAVKEIRLFVDGKTDDMRIPVIIEIDPSRIAYAGDTGTSGESNLPKTVRAHMERLVARGMRAQLTPQSFLTGQLLIELKFRPDREVKKAPVYDGYPSLPTISSDLDLLIHAAKELPLKQIVMDFSEAVGGINRLVNSPDTRKTLTSLNNTLMRIQTLTARIDKNLPPLIAAMTHTATSAGELMENVNGGLPSMATAVTDTVETARVLMENLDNGIPPALSSVTGVADDARKLVRNLDAGLLPIVSNLEATSKAAATVLGQAETTLKNIGRLAEEDSPVLYELTKTFRELSEASRSVRIMADYLERHPEAMLRGKNPETSAP